jgi:hypothetical protein
MPTMRVSEHPEFDPDFSLDFAHWDQVVGDAMRALALEALGDARLAAELTRKPGGESDWMKGVAAGAHRILNVIADHAEIPVPTECVV